MLVFWIVAAMFTVGALLVLLPGLLRPRAGGVDASEAALAVHRDQWREAAADVETGRLGADQLAAARFEIDQRAREEAAAGTRTPSAQPARRTAAALALLLPAASVALYLALGDPQAATSPAAVIAQHSTSPDQVQKMVAALAERLKAQPDDVDGWTMLGRSYVALGRHRDAATALQRANALAPGNASLLADLADVLAMAQGRKLAGEPARDDPARARCRPEACEGAGAGRHGGLRSQGLRGGARLLAAPARRGAGRVAARALGGQQHCRSGSARRRWHGRRGQRCQTRCGRAASAATSASARTGRAHRRRRHAVHLRPRRRGAAHAAGDRQTPARNCRPRSRSTTRWRCRRR